MDVSELQNSYSYDPDTGIVSTSKDSKRWRKGHAMGWLSSSGYLYTKVAGACIPVHRIAYALYHGEWPEKKVDHVNRVKTDNRICNLRIVSDSQNSANQGIRSDNTSGKKGVTWNKRRGKWQTQIQLKGRRISRLFDCIGDAASFYDQCAAGLDSDHFTTNRILDL